MSEGNDQDTGQDTGKARLSLRPAGRMELGRTVDAGSVRQSFSHGRSKVVQVEVRKSRAPAAAPATRPATPGQGAAPAAPAQNRGGAAPSRAPGGGGRPGAGGRALTATELAA